MMWMCHGHVQACILFRPLSRSTPSLYAFSLFPFLSLALRVSFSFFKGLQLGSSHSMQTSLALEVVRKKVSLLAFSLDMKSETRTPVNLSLIAHVFLTMNCKGFIIKVTYLHTYRTTGLEKLAGTGLWLYLTPGRAVTTTTSRTRTSHRG